MKSFTNPTDAINQLRDDLSRQQRRIRELERQLADARNGKLPEDEHIDPELLSVQSMVASQTGEPMVLIRWFTHIAQVPVEAAREIALNLLDTAEAARSDAFLMGFFKNKIGADMQQVGGLIAEFREYRQQPPALPAKEKTND